jgi:hypothetical protein
MSFAAVWGIALAFLALFVTYVLVHVTRYNWRSGFLLTAGGRVLTGLAAVAALVLALCGILTVIEDALTWELLLPTYGSLASVAIWFYATATSRASWALRRRERLPR